MQRVDVKFRLLARLETAGAKGLTKTELARFVQIPADDLNRALAVLLGEFLIVEYIDQNSKYGRKPARYWHKDFVPDLTPRAPSVTNDTNSTLDSPAAPGGVCKQCGAATSIVLGKAQDYCTPECRQMAKLGGITRKSLLAQAASPHTFMRLCILFVAEDLLLRGYSIAFDSFGSGVAILVFDEHGGIRLPVLAAVTFGGLPSMQYLADGRIDSAAVVFNDGRIRYVGKNPLVAEPEVVADSESKS